MRGHTHHYPPPVPDVAADRVSPGPRRQLYALAAAGITLVLGLLTMLVPTGSAAADDNPYQRGPDPTPASVAAVNGPFATASVSVPTGYGFGGGMIYYPTDTSQGTFGGIAISPGYTALFSVELAWMGPWLASHGFVVIGIETNSTNDFDEARGTQLLAALDYLTQQSPVRDRVDPNRLAVSGHSMGGGGALNAAIRRPSLRAAVGLAPFLPSSNLANDRVPTMVFAGQADTVVTPSYLNGLYGSLPSTTESVYLEVAGGDHGFPVGRPNTVMIRTMLPFVKMFVDNDTRYSQFLCPLLDYSGVTQYRSTCPLLPGTPTTPPTTSTATPSTGPTQGPGTCTATLRIGQVWGDRYNTYVTVSGASAWTVVVAITPPQRIVTTWNGDPSWDSSGTVMTMRANGSGNEFGFTTMFNGNPTARPEIRSCTAM